MSANTVLELINIKKSFGEKQILKGINYEFKSGHMYAILGESGNGKTTLLNIIGLIDNLYEGTVILSGQTLERKKDYASLRAEKIGFIFQSYYLLDTLTVRENICLPLKYSKTEFNQEYFESVVEKLSISQILDENVNYLSGGEKQRVSIARALINKPELIICDEPTGNLDEKNAYGVIDLLKSFISEERTIILVTHSKDIASKCTDILTLRGGILHE